MRRYSGSAASAAAKCCATAFSPSAATSQVYRRRTLNRRAVSGRRQLDVARPGNGRRQRPSVHGKGNSILGRAHDQSRNPAQLRQARRQIAAPHRPHLAKKDRWLLGQIATK